MKNTSAFNIVKTPAILLTVLALSSGLSCAVAPDSKTKPVATPTQRASTSSQTMESAWSAYDRRDFATAAAGYDELANDEDDRQLALLGKALVHLSTDAQWRNLDEAARLLQASEQMDNNGASVQTSMLINALSSLIGAEANNSELNTKVSNSSREIAQLKAEQEALVAEQSTLNEALEKLKALTIGN